MGIQDRDYYRDDSGGFLDGRAGPRLTPWLIAITCCVFFGQVITRDPIRNPLAAFGVYHPEWILQGQVWRLLTPVFLHADLIHLICNMLILYWAGRRVEDVYGGWEFLAFYLGSAVFSLSVYLLAYLLGLTPPSIALGASGAVTAVLVLCAFNFPRLQVLLFFVIPMPVWLLTVLYVLADALGALGAFRAPVAYLVHLAGAAFGAIYYTSGLRLTRLLSRSPRSGPRTRPRLRVVSAGQNTEPAPSGVTATADPPPPSAATAEPSLEARVDAVLDKVARHGRSSLTPEEQSILLQASEFYKKRRK